MSEAVVVNSFLIVRVFLVGGILLILPRINRKGLLFGVYVGEEFTDGGERRGVLRGWDRGCVMVMAISLLVGLTISVTGHPVGGNLTGTAVLLLAGLGLYLRTYSRVRQLAPSGVERQADKATATLQVQEPRGEPFAKLTLLICLVAALATVIYALLSYRGMPTPMPTLLSLIGGADGWTDRPFLTVMYLPSWNLVVGPLFALLGIMVATAKRSLRDGPGGRSAEAQDAFRALMATVFSGIALSYSALLTLLSVQVIRVGLSQARWIGAGFLVLLGAALAFMLGSLILIMRRYGQGGALLERGPEGGALTGGLADNAHWVWGLFYVNRDDPSLMLESRFGIGYTLNYGNRNAVIFVVAAGSLIIHLTVLGFFL
ncbi:MAG: DUF5808 domain-containing protein [Dehalococcoidia bacterium]